MASSVVCVLSAEPSIPSMQRLLLDDIHLDTSFNYKYIKCKINVKYALFSNINTKRMKLVLEEAVGEDATPTKRINVFLNGAFAEEFIQFSVGDTVIISEALICKSTSFGRDGIHPCNIVVENTKSRPSVWVIPAKTQNSTTANTSNRSRQSRLNPPSISAITSSSLATACPASPTINRNQGTRETVGAHLEAGPSTSTVTSSVPTTNGMVTVTSENVTQDRPHQSSWTTPCHTMDAWATQDGSPSKRNYSYTLLKDLKEESKVNIFGIVKFFKPPYKTKGPDYCMTVTLIDPSLDANNLDRGLRCQLFRDDVKALPQVNSIGDIVRFHRLKITQFHGNFQGKKGDGFQCLVFDGCLDSSLDPRSSSPNFTLTDDDKKKVRDLRLWSASHTQLAVENPCCTLAKCYMGQYFDLVCQVVFVAKLPAERCTVIKVWDGTRARGEIRRMSIGAATSTQEDQTLDDKSDGLSVDVSLYDDHMETGALLKPGEFIKLCNLHAAKWRDPGRGEDIVEFVIHRGTSYGRGVIVLNDWIPEVKDTLKRMEEVSQNILSHSCRTAANQRTDPASSSNQSSSGTVPIDVAGRGGGSVNGSVQGTPNRCMQRSASVINDHFHIKVTRIRDVLKSEAPNKFRVRAKVSDYFSNHIKEFVKLRCPKCNLRIGVPSPQKTKPVQFRHVLRQSLQEKRAAQRNAPSKEGVDGGASQGVQTRSASQKNSRVADSTGVMTRGRSRHPDGTDASSAEESSPRRQVKPRKRPVSGSSGSEAVTSSTLRKNRRGTSKMAHKGKVTAEIEAGCSRTSEKNGRSTQGVDDENSTLTGDSEKRLTMTDIHGLTITAEIASSRDDEKEETRRKRRKKWISVSINKLTITEALPLARLGMRLVGHPDLPTILDEAGYLQHQAPGGNEYFVCPICETTDGDLPADPGDAILLEYRYCIKLVLDDDTGSIEVIVDGDRAKTFFQGIPASNLSTSTDSKFRLEEVMAKLCPFPLGQGFDTPAEGDNRPVRSFLSHPWLECCILSYVVRLNGEELIKYQIFDTSLALDVE